MLTHSKTPQEQPNKQSLEISTVRKKLGKETLAIDNLNFHNSKMKTLNKNLQIFKPEFLLIYSKVLSKRFANLLEAQVTFCHFSKYPKTETIKIKTK